MSNRVERALLKAAEAAESSSVRWRTTGDAVRRDVVIGDPQAPLATFLGILERHDLLSDEGILADDVHLTSIGDHFDFGGIDRAEAAGIDGLRLLAWLAAHDAKRTTIIAGNHDLGRVGELNGFDDRTFGVARERAARVYASGDRNEEAALLKRYPALPSAELAARDFAAFLTAQRELVVRLMREGRMVLAAARGPTTLICHAGITVPELDSVDISGDAEAIADGLNRRFADAVVDWNGRTPFEIPGLHRPGNAVDGEGGGALYHRPCVGGDPAEFVGDLRRRFDPSTLPTSVIQVVGHIRDNKCRKLLAPCCDDDEVATDGPLRHLIVDAEQTTRYRFGTIARIDPEERAMIFVDGGMGYGGAPRYELLDLSTMAAHAG